MEWFKLLEDIVALMANVFAIAASFLALYVFFAKRKELSAALSIILNWTYQVTLTDITGKLDRLNEYNANEPDDQPEIRNILHEIAGQFRGNTRLMAAAQAVPDRLEALAAGRKLTEPGKRSMVAEIREVVRNLKVQAIDVGRTVNE